MKYEYLLHTWGGFYNKEHQDKHGEVEGYHYFDTKQERSDYLAKLRKIEKELNAMHLATTISEGYNTRTVTTLHRVVKWEGKEYYTILVLMITHLVKILTMKTMRLKQYKNG